MKIVIVHGQNHKGSTYNVSHTLAKKLSNDITEFFLPKDFSHFCVGCNQCLNVSETKCPHYTDFKRITDELDTADVLIFASPVYVYHVTGQMKAFLDHFGSRWMLHRPCKAMFNKQAVAISTCAGGGTKSCNKDLTDSFRWWGISRYHSLGFTVRATKYEAVKPEILQKIDKSTTKLAKKIKKVHKKKCKVTIKTRLMFKLCRFLHTLPHWKDIDKEYFKENGWDKKHRPWK